GGFLLDAAFSPQRLSELAKMDGAIILATDCSRIARANVHLVPNPNTPTSETGTRHRTAERVARSTNVPVTSVSEDMGSLGVDGRLVRLQLEEVVGGVEDDRRLIVRDYFHADEEWTLDDALDGLERLDAAELLDLKRVAEMLHLPEGEEDLDGSLTPKGFRM